MSLALHLCEDIEFEEFHPQLCDLTVVLKCVCMCERERKWEKEKEGERHLCSAQSMQCILT